MKTEITYRHQLEEGHTICKVIPIDTDNCVLITTRYPDNLKIEVIGSNSKVIDIDQIPELEKGYGYKCFFKYNNGFGLIDGSTTVVIWDNIIDAPEIIKIDNPLPPDEHNRKHHISFSTYDSADGNIYCGIEDMGRYGYPARYWAKLELSKKKMWLFSSSATKAKWGKLNYLDLENYPPTDFGKYPHEWLSISHLMRKNNKIYLHTIGGGVTRVKSGPDYEFSLITELTNEGAFIKNYAIEEGKGFFTSSKEYYICHPQKNKKRLLFYNTANFTVDLEISLSPKQNLAEGNSKFIIADVCYNNLYLYNATFFNICKLIPAQ